MATTLAERNEARMLRAAERVASLDAGLARANALAASSGLVHFVVRIGRTGYVLRAAQMAVIRPPTRANILGTSHSAGAGAGVSCVALTHSV